MCVCIGIYIYMYIYLYIYTYIYKYKYYIFFIYSPVSGHLGRLHVLAIVNSAAMNTGVHVSFQIKSFLQIYAQEWDCWSKRQLDF